MALDFLAKTITFYYNGLAKTTSYVTQQTVTLSNFAKAIFLGGLDHNGSLDAAFPGYLGCVAMYPAVLSSSRVMAHYLAAKGSRRRRILCGE